MVLIKFISFACILFIL
uniref:Uncharacterized protein n=1 Tax=Anguilla anguilla TaxID=7936 RepID=A0A0E9Q0X1_ANGAN